MKFLFQRHEPPPTASILIVQTCNPDLLVHVVRDLRHRFPAGRLSLFIQRGMRPFLPELPVDEIWENHPEERRESVRRMREMRFDLAAITESAEHGFWKLKLLPLIIAPRSIWVYDRMARVRRLSLAVLLAAWTRGIGNAESKLTLRRLAAPVIFWQVWRFYRKRTRR